MEYIEDLNNIDLKLQSLKKDFNDQMNAIDGDIKEFHKQFSNVLTEYPDLKNLVDFIVFTNDNLERTQKDMKGVVSESINELISIKKDLVNTNIKSRNKDITKIKEKKSSLNIFSTINTFKDLKWVITAFLIILTILGFMIVPDTMVQALSWLAKASI